MIYNYLRSLKIFGGIEFNVGRREIGHIQGDQFADTRFSMNVRNQLVSYGKAEPDRIVPKSGWITFRFRNEADIAQGIELFRLSYQIASKRLGK